MGARFKRCKGDTPRLSKAFEEKLIETCTGATSALESLSV